MEKVTTAAGVQFDTDYLVTSRNTRLYVRILNADIVTVARVFSDPEETIRLIYGGEVLENYTRLVSLANEDEAVKVCLEKE